MEEIKYKYTAIGRNATKEVFPQNGNTFAVTWEKEDENAYFRKKLKGKMLFIGEDFHWLYVFENSQYRCDPITLLIEKKCSGDFSEFFLARLILNNADWDLDQCTCSIEAEEEDRYTCYNDNKDKEYNLLQIVYPKRVVGLVQGTLEYQNCFGSNPSGSSPGDPQWCGAGDVADGWSIQSYYQTNPVEGGGGGFPEEGGTFNITWVREVITSATPLGAPWISIGGDQYAKFPNLYGYRSYGGQYDYGYDYQVGGSIDNGMSLKDAIQSLISQSCYPMKVKSRFFNWDPDPIMNKNLVDPLKMTSNANLDINGYVVASGDANDKVTDYIRVIPGTELWLQNPGTLGGGGTTNFFYDKNKQPLSATPPVPGASFPIKIADVPLNAYYVRYEDYGSPTTAMIYMGTGATTYQPYDYNHYVTGQRSKVDNLILFQKSDVKRPNGSGNASVGNTTLEKLVKDLCNMFNLKWDIDDDGNFIMEHVSFFQKGVGLNLVGRFDERLRAGKRKYSYDIDKTPRREIFQFMDDKYTYGDFKGVPIIYSNSCVGKGEKEDKDWIVESIITDVSFVLNNPSSDSQIVSDDGFVLIACDANYNIISEASILGGNTLNNSLSWARLHVDYWRHDRIFNRFSMNNVQTNALSVIPTKKGIKLDVTLCCGEVFDPENKVLSELGEGIVSEASFDLYKENLSLTLLYASDENLVVNLPPVANNDVVVTWIGLTIDIDVLANDTDADGVINPGTLMIGYGSANGTASVVGNKIRYTPNPGYTGDDIITYTVKDNWSEISNVGTVNITVKPGSPIPIAGDDNFSTGEDVVLTIGTVLSNDTGDGALTCVPETKATEQGGSVQIYANGSAVYTPPAGYIGDDGFEYTLKDANNNTDVGHVDITVFAKQQVYARYSEDNSDFQDIMGFCETSTGNFTEQVIGTKNVFDLHVNFYSDALGTVPLNVTGYGLQVKLKQIRTGDGAFTTTYNIPVSGLEYLQEETVSSWNEDGCTFGTDDGPYNYNDSYSLESSPDYIIL